MKPKKSERAAAEPKYRMNARERAAIEKHFRRMGEGAPRLKVVKTADKTNISADHPSWLIGQALLTEALGTSDLDFYNGPSLSGCLYGFTLAGIAGFKDILVLVEDS